MLKSFFAAVINSFGAWLGKFMPFYPAYLIVVFLALTAYLAFGLIKHAFGNLRKSARSCLICNLAFTAVLFLIIWFHYEQFLLFGDEKKWFQQALEYSRTGRSGLLLSDSIMTFFFGAILYPANAATLKAVLYLLLSVHFLLWKMILEDVFKLGMIAASGLVLFCAVVCIYSVVAVSSYMVLGYMLSSLAAYLALKNRPESSGGGPDLLPFIALLAVLFRQECFILFPLIFIHTLLLGTGKTRRLLLLSAMFMLSLPALYSSWKDELNMNKETFDRKFALECYYSGDPLQTGYEPRIRADGRRHLRRRVRNVRAYYKPGISANKSYMQNILVVLAGQKNVREDEIIDLSEALYNAPNPSFQNIYYNLKFRKPWLLLVTAAGFVSMFLGIVFLKPLRPPLVFLGCMTVFYFVIFYAQKYSVGWFERFYFYLFPLYGCFLAVSLKLAVQTFFKRQSA